MDLPLRYPADWDGFAARLPALLAGGDAGWAHAVGAQSALFGDSAEATAMPWVAPDGFDDLGRQVAMHDDDSRYARLLAFARRLQREPGLWADVLDRDRRALQSMARQVRREIHAMHAFVRFREVADETVAAGRRHVAWFEPAHHVLRAAAPFFVKRFAQHPWAILTPRGCLHWDGQRLAGAGPARREDAPAEDAGEGLWLTYYRSIFNPARLKVTAMKRQMEVRYWAHMPETRQISALVREAAEREGRMRGV
ncbi:TIGR03915 family putative DNA repair protein [Roseateles cellulosilyticus]|uniref:TIGR03915 family putative DNA repair protein n=1 Tax=Pelomonas cellulosilytica TaxID=2906762 RepID=A0ABS8Y014_9BURK|nr:TIGR03915 family putative DNA repair protein [Pelomonas sp. P8]MCE4558191.1 TIGR03915 family putative DNA repair protein [Pelomonas sp. P8]